MKLDPAVAVILGELVGPLAKQIFDWLEGEAPEPPALVHIGVPEVALVKARERAKAAAAFK